MIAKLWPDDPARQLRWRQLMAWLDPQPGETVLDVGCGRGAAISYIASQVGPGGRAVGMDRLPGYLAGPRPPGAPVGSADPLGVCGDGQALPFVDESFDAILCVNVLEAMLDRPRAIAEMRRVLRPGGRILLAHDDYESQVYAGADRDLTRRAVLAYANAKFQSYATSDGQMGRYLWGLFSRAGFADAEVRVLPLVNLEYREPLVGWSNAQFGASFVATVSDLTQPEIDRWRDQLAAATERGDYVYCLNLYVCFGYNR